MTNKAIAIYTQLEQLDDTSTEEDVTRIVGNDSLTRIECSECGESVSEAVAVGDGYLCGGCVQRAVEIFTQRKG
jgi:formylmethanofuran dehydrogenase subunit E